MLPPRQSKITYERRAALRLQLPRGHACRVVVPPAPQAYEGGIYRVSVAGGLDLLLAGPLPVGAWLVIQLQDGGPTFGDAIAAQVRHATPRPDGRWLVGCSAAHGLTLREEEVLLSALASPD
jgi:hypothetical protein